MGLRHKRSFGWLRLGLALALALAGLDVSAEPPRVASADGRWLVQGEGLELVLRDAQGAEVRRWPGQALGGGAGSAVRLLLPLAARRSVLVGFATLAELWELQLDPAAEPIFNGLVHDYRLGEGVAEPGFLGLRRTRLPEPVRDLVTDRSGAWVLARGSDQADGRAVLHLLQLDIRRAVARWVLDADPVLERSQTGGCEPRECLQVPDRRGGAALLLDWRAARLLDKATMP